MVDARPSGARRRSTRIREALSLALFAGALAGACRGSSNLRDGWPRERVEALPADLRAAYALFSYRCSRCHTLSRPLRAGIADPEHWRVYVARMRRTPGSGISPEDAVLILSFLEYHAAEVRRRRAEGDPWGARLDGASTPSSDEAERGE